MSKTNEQNWNRETPGTYRRNTGERLQTRVVDRDPRTGRGKTIWVAYDAAGMNLGKYVSRQAGVRAVEAVLVEREREAKRVRSNAPQIVEFRFSDRSTARLFRMNVVDSNGEEHVIDYSHFQQPIRIDGVPVHMIEDGAVAQATRWLAQALFQYKMSCEDVVVERVRV